MTDFTGQAQHIPIPAPTAPPAGLPTATGYDPWVTTTTYGGYNNQPDGPICSRDSHYFECQHMVVCRCGRVARRTELQVDRGL